MLIIIQFNSSIETKYKLVMKIKKKIDPSAVSFEFLYAEPFNQKDYLAICDLLGQLSPGKTLTEDDFLKLTAENTVIVARLPNKHIVGMATLAQHSSYGGTSYWVEDVVADAAYRGLRIGQGAMEKLLWVARETGIKRLKLTSKKARVATRALYAKLGFKIADYTDLFVLDIKKPE
jgi:GNAT superfamily N-acetyltransferase